MMRKCLFYPTQSNQGIQRPCLLVVASLARLVGIGMIIRFHGAWGMGMGINSNHNSTSTSSDLSRV